MDKSHNIPLRPGLTAGNEAVFDPTSGELHHAGGTVSLPAQLSAFLALLAAARGEVVRRETVQKLSHSFADPHEARRMLVLRAVDRFMRSCIAEAAPD